uniref:Uncharacterized protein n=1 Tax=Sphaerodactylus townsendi TaxID=933632 RepID=A0ACB8F2B4_9SAUR
MLVYVTVFRMSRGPPGSIRGDYTVEVSINDYLDIYCPHYEIPFPMDRMEQCILYMVNYEGAIPVTIGQNGFKAGNVTGLIPLNTGMKFSERFQLFCLSRWG